MNHAHPSQPPHRSPMFHPTATAPSPSRRRSRTILVVGAAVLGWVALLGSCVAWLWRDIAALDESAEAFAHACGTHGSNEHCARATTGQIHVYMDQIRASFGELESIHGPFTAITVAQFCRNGVGNGSVGQIGGTMEFERGVQPVVINFAKVDGTWRVSEIGTTKDDVARLCSD